MLQTFRETWIIYSLVAHRMFYYKTHFWLKKLKNVIVNSTIDRVQTASLSHQAKKYLQK